MTKEEFQKYNKGYQNGYMRALCDSLDSCAGENIPKEIIRNMLEDLGE